MNIFETYDLAVIGGGLAGLANAILVAKAGFRVVLFEKENYPFHRVCGEYISNESREFLHSLGVPFENWRLPSISQLTVSAANGTAIHHPLSMGGFGVSRHLLDAHLAQAARQCGVTILEKTKVEDVRREGDGFALLSGKKTTHASMVFGAFGKKSALDVKWKRSFAEKMKKERTQYIGVKYHIETELPANRIFLHNFQGGYCGVSAIENNRYCCCYLAKAKDLKNAGSIPALEGEILQKNPYLRELWRNARFIWPEPVTISQISFAPKPLIENDIWMGGDAAGMIPPLCGNGMSMALHAAKMAAENMIAFLSGSCALSTAETQYMGSWNRSFQTRLRTGRWLQRCFGHTIPTNLFLGMMRPFPRIIGYLESRTHGQPF